MAAVALRHLQRTLRRSSSLSCASLQSGPLSGSKVSSRPIGGKYAAPEPALSDLQPASRTSVAAYHSSRSAGDSYASDVHSYNNLISQINSKKRHYLNRDVYEDMLLDGIQPVRDTFFLLITGAMQTARLHEVMYYFDEMKAMGVIPDISMYNCIIAACGRSKQVDRAFQVAEEMEAFGIQPKNRTFLALLRACASAGRLDEAYGVVRRMAANGLTLDKHCYASLIAAHKKKKPQNIETEQKIFELLERSKTVSAEDVMAVAATGEAESGDDADDWLLNFLSSDEAPLKRGFINRRLTVYHAALSAFQELGNREALKKVIEMIGQDGHVTDAYCTTQLIICHISEGDFEKACSEYEKFLEQGRRPTLDLYLILIDGALTHPSPANSATAQKLLTEMKQKGFFLNLLAAVELLSKACQGKTRDLAVANMVWDLTQNRGVRLPVGVTVDYQRALERSGVPKDDPRMTQIRSCLENGRYPKAPPSAEPVAAVEPELPLSEPVREVPTAVSLEPAVVAEASSVGEEPVVANEEVPEAEQSQAHGDDASDTVSSQAVQQ